jgi:hypothetical protein
MKRVVLLATAAVTLALLGFASCASSSKSEVAPVGAGPAPVNVERAPVIAPPAPAAEPAPVAAAPPAATEPVVAATPMPAPTPVAAAAGATDYTGPDPCTMATKGDSPVAKACREGGIKAAKVSMKELLKSARANGVKYQCDDCHINDTDYAQLGKGAEDKFARLVAAANRK